jgi:hypothetical protein
VASVPANGRTRRGPRAAAVAGLSVALCSSLAVACSSSSGSGTKPAAASGAGAPAAAPATTATGGSQRPACGLVTQAEIEAAVGVKVNAGRESVDEFRSVCSFVVVGATDPGVILTSTTSPSSAAGFARVRDNLGDAAQPIDLGDKAFAAEPQAAVLKGSTLVAVLVTVRPAPAGAATKVAEAAAAHL